MVPSWYIDSSNFCSEARYKSNQDFGAPVAPRYPDVHGVNPWVFSIEEGIIFVNFFVCE